MTAVFYFQEIWHARKKFRNGQIMGESEMDKIALANNSSRIKRTSLPKRALAQISINTFI